MEGRAVREGTIQEKEKEKQEREEGLTGLTFELLCDQHLCGI